MFNGFIQIGLLSKVDVKFCEATLNRISISVSLCMLVLSLRGLGSTLPEASYSFCEGDEKMSQNWL